MSMVQELLRIGLGVDTDPAISGLRDFVGEAEGALSPLEGTLSQASDGLREVGKQSGTAARGMSGLASVVSLINPQLGTAIRSVGNLSRGLGLLRLGLGPAALLVGAVSAALYHYNVEQERAARLAASAASANDALMASQGRLQATLSEVEETLGDTLDIEERLIRVRQQAFAESLPGFQDMARAVNESHREVLRLEGEYRDLMAMNASDTSIQIGLDKLNEQIAVHRQLQADQNVMIDNLREMVDLREELAIAEHEEEETARENLRLSHQQIEADTQRLELIKGIAEEQYRASEERKNQIIEEARLLADKEAETAAYLEDLDRERQAARMAMNERVQQQIRDHQERRARMEAEIGSVIEGVTDLALMSARKKADEDERAAKRSLMLSKTLGLAKIAIDTAVGIQKALSESAGNPIAAALKIASLVVSGVAQAATVSAQTLHQGGTLSPDEQQVRTVILRDETVTEGGRVLSPEASRRMERGEGKAQTVVIPAFQHFGEFFADVVESGGTPLHDLIYEGRTLGRVGY